MLKIVLSLFLLSPALSAQSVQPGLWQTEISFEVNGIPLPPSVKKECLSASEAKDIKATILSELQRQGCTATKWTLKGTHLQVSLSCQKAGLQATGSLRGTVTAKNYALNGDAEGTFQQLPSQAVISLKGHWLKSCPQ